jgi:hypothetical protein
VAPRAESFLHSRSEKQFQVRKIRGIIFCRAYRDLKIRETVSRVDRVDVLRLIAEPVDVDLVPDVVKGEVLSDSRGEGSFQCAC